ncbi:hypothetical protein NDU88_002548 [Pleurodeles waltl]|uniref:Uncharacterized protein n=1 Tax=Pleurodeles waltl TaxID=8319 RepID=A0AAV7MXS2_PLEWA|nr:hypothetical protein NDU88_002548 [Pleurodeles waltl]
MCRVEELRFFGGGAIVIMNTFDYRQECLRLLSDTTHYAPLVRDPTNELQINIRSMIEEARNNSWISPKEAEFLDTTHPRVPYFYCLPKIHKGPIVQGLRFCIIMHRGPGSYIFELCYKMADIVLLGPRTLQFVFRSVFQDGREARIVVLS